MWQSIHPSKGMWSMKLRQLCSPVGTGEDQRLVQSHQWFGETLPQISCCRRLRCPANVRQRDVLSTSAALEVILREYIILTAATPDLQEQFNVTSPTPDARQRVQLRPKPMWMTILRILFAKTHVGVSTQKPATTTVLLNMTMFCTPEPGFDCAALL